MLKQLKSFLFIFVSIIVIIVVCVKVLNIPDIILKKIYPKKYSEYVYKYSEQYELDPLLVFAVVKAESNFDETVVSSSGAVGLMQLMESTALEQSKKLNIDEYNSQDLFVPETNIQIGTAYLAELINKYNGNYYIAVTAYNAGIGVVDGWIADGTIEEDGSNIEKIPYKETNNYVRKIVKNYNMYQQLY